MKNIALYCYIAIFSFTIVGYSETGTKYTGKWNAGYISNVEIYKNTTYGKFIRLTTSADVAIYGFYNSEWWKDDYITKVVYIPWNTQDEIFSTALFSSLQRAIDDQSKSVVFYSVKVNTWDATGGGVATIVYDLRIF